MPDVANQMYDVVAAIISDDLDGARQAFSYIDREQIVREWSGAYAPIWGPGGIASRAEPHQASKRSSSPTEKRKLAIFGRDQFTCRYAHCRRRTIYLPILTAVAGALPDLQPSHPYWTPRDDHVLFWTYGTSLEHHVAVARGGTSNDDNLITTCYQCNDLKNSLTAEDLGWALAPERAPAWDGLMYSLPALKTAVENLN